MATPESNNTAPVLLITGASARLGAATARLFHQRGFRVAIHYNRSGEAAQRLAGEMCQLRADSATTLGADLSDIPAVEALPNATEGHFGRLDALINNASAFYPTPWGAIDEQNWQELIDSNLKGPAFLCQAALPALRNSDGCIINMIDIHAERPLASHPVYCMAKAGLAMLTQSLAVDSGIRSNGIAPGAILWPSDQALDAQQKGKIVDKVPLGRTGDADDIAHCAWYLANDAPYVNGQIISVDGGRSCVS